MCACIVCVCVRVWKKVSRSMYLFFPFRSLSQRYKSYFSTSRDNTRDLRKWSKETILCLFCVTGIWNFVMWVVLCGECGFSFLFKEVLEYGARSSGCQERWMKGYWAGALCENALLPSQYFDLRVHTNYTTDYSPRQYSDKHTRGSSYTVILILNLRIVALGAPILDAFTSNRIDISCMIT